jgi:hypothetical protein
MSPPSGGGKPKGELELMNRPELQLIINKPFIIQVKAEGTVDPIGGKPFWRFETKAEFQKRILGDVREQIDSFWPAAAAFLAPLISPGERPALARATRWLDLYQSGLSVEKIRRRHAKPFSPQFITREIRRAAKRLGVTLRASRTYSKR